MSEVELNFSHLVEGSNTSGIIAKYPGWCKACENAIHEGEDVITFSEEYDTYIHIGCYTPPGPRSDIMHNDMCMVCWQARAANGTCGCIE